MANGRGKNILTPEFRGSFVHLYDFENDPATGQPSNKHAITMLFPKQSADWTKDLAWLYENILEALLMQYPNWQGLLPVFTVPDASQKAWPISDGDLPNTRGTIQDAHRGHWVVTARAGSAFFDPNVNLMQIDPTSGQSIPVPQSMAFSGCFYEAQINAYYYDQGPGIAIGLNNVKYVRTGESLGGGGEDASAAWGVAASPAMGAAAAFPAPGAPVAGTPVAPGLPVVPPAPAGAPPAMPAPVAPVAPVPGYPAPGVPTQPGQAGAPVVPPAPVAPPVVPGAPAPAVAPPAFLSQ